MAVFGDLKGENPNGSNFPESYLFVTTICHSPIAASSDFGRTHVLASHRLLAEKGDKMVKTLRGSGGSAGQRYYSHVTSATKYSIESTT